MTAAVVTIGRRTFAGLITAGVALAAAVVVLFGLLVLGAGESSPLEPTRNDAPAIVTSIPIPNGADAPGPCPLRGRC